MIKEYYAFNELSNSIDSECIVCIWGRRSVHCSGSWKSFLRARKSINEENFHFIYKQHCTMCVCNKLSSFPFSTSHQPILCLNYDLGSIYIYTSNRWIYRDEINVMNCWTLFIMLHWTIRWRRRRQIEKKTGVKDWNWLSCKRFNIVNKA